MSCTACQQVYSYYVNGGDLSKVYGTPVRNGEPCPHDRPEEYFGNAQSQQGYNLFLKENSGEGRK
jgi:hypothetical protein